LIDQSNKEKESLSSQLKKEKRSKQLLIESLENLHSQELKETIEKKLVEKKGELEKLKLLIAEKLGNDQNLLENFLEKQEDFDLALFDNVDQTSRPFLRAKDKLQDAKNKLIAKIGSEEVEELYRIQAEIGKLETSQSQWKKMEEQFESFTETPPTTPRN
jgi:hypothetical protein